MNVNIILYDDFETLDALGIANIFEKHQNIFTLISVRKRRDCQQQAGGQSLDRNIDTR